MLPAKPLGLMHGDAARRTLEEGGATVETGVRVDDLDDLDADAIVVATPPAESARLLGEAEPELDPSPIVSVHLLFDRPLLRTPLAALLGSDAHWVFDRGALTGHPIAEGQYLTVVSSGVPELMEIRGRELVEHIASQLTDVSVTPKSSGRASAASRTRLSPFAPGPPRAAPVHGRRVRMSHARARGQRRVGPRRWRARSFRATAARLLSDMTTKVAA